MGPAEPNRFIPCSIDADTTYPGSNKGCEPTRKATKGVEVQALLKGRGQQLRGVGRIRRPD